MLGWLDTRAIEAHIPVIDKSERLDGAFPATDFIFDPEADEYTCPGGNKLKKYRRTMTRPRSGISNAVDGRTRAGDGRHGISKSQVSRLCEEIDERVDAFLSRPIHCECHAPSGSNRWRLSGSTRPTSRCGKAGASSLRPSPSPWASTPMGGARFWAWRSLRPRHSGDGLHLSGPSSSVTSCAGVSAA